MYACTDNCLLNYEWTPIMDIDHLIMGIHLFQIMFKHIISLKFARF